MKSYSIVGMNFRGTEDVVRKLAGGEPLKLVREPGNKFDKNAVAVWMGDVCLGYVPRTQNSVLAAFIDTHGQSWTPPEADPTMAIDAAFERSPNSGYPLVRPATIVEN